MTVSFTDEGWRDYVSWLGDQRMLRQILKLIADVQCNGHSGLGKPERLRGDRSGWWNRRIDDKHRLVYRLTDGAVEIAQCRGHYADR
jgi:toxin YoeB